MIPLRESFVSRPSKPRMVSRYSTVRLICWVEISKSVSLCYCFSLLLGSQRQIRDILKLTEKSLPICVVIFWTAHTLGTIAHHLASRHKLNPQSLEIPFELQVSNCFPVLEIIGTSTFNLLCHSSVKCK